ncbi:MAG: HDOD domain-containing protein [Ectothiorhodospiraceae bacterium]|jgi:putative nucleotidyltransferase with HDIG domain|nr:HDOD domain-containing protein [Ectothiorhodospiraceae bacterium]
MSSLNLDELIRQVGGLASLPAIVTRLNAMLADENTSTAEIAKMVSQDPGLSMRLLKVANSPFYGLSTHVDTVSRAITVIGREPFHELLLATAVTRAFHGIPEELITMEDFWRHSVYCAVAARLMAEKVLPARSESIFVAGLLHDIGRLVIFKRLPEKAHEAYLLGLAQGGGMEPQAAERAVMGFDHAQVGGALAQEWCLPQSLQECIRCHHEPRAADAFQVEAAIVHIANTVAHMAQLDTRDLRDAPPIDPLAWERTGLTEDMVGELVEAAEQQVVEAESILLG